MARASGVEIDPSGTLQEEVLVSVRATAENLNSMAMELRFSGPSPEVREKLRIFRASSSHHLYLKPRLGHLGTPWGGVKAV